MTLTRYALPGPHTCVAERRGASRALSLSPVRLIRHLRLLLGIQRELPMVHVCCSAPEPDPNWRTWHVYPVVCLGRYEGTEKFLGRRERTYNSLHSSFTRRENLNKCLVQPCALCATLWQ